MELQMEQAGIRLKTTKQVLTEDTYGFGIRINTCNAQAYMVPTQEHLYNQPALLKAL